MHSHLLLFVFQNVLILILVILALFQAYILLGKASGSTRSAAASKIPWHLSSFCFRSLCAPTQLSPPGLWPAYSFISISLSKAAPGLGWWPSGTMWLHTNVLQTMESIPTSLRKKVVRTKTTKAILWEFKQSLIILMRILSSPQEKVQEGPNQQKQQMPYFLTLGYYY